MAAPPPAVAAPPELVTLEELADFLDDQDLATDDRARTVLDLVEGLVRDHCGWPISAVADEVARLDGSGSSALFLPSLHVTNVSGVVEDPDGAAVDLAVGTDFEWSDSGTIRRTGGGLWARRFRFYEVTFDHGYAAVPDGVKTVVLRVAARALTNPEGLGQETVPGFSAVYRDAGAVLTAADERSLGRYAIGSK